MTKYFFYNKILKSSSFKRDIYISKEHSNIFETPPSVTNSRSKRLNKKKYFSLSFTHKKTSSTEHVLCLCLNKSPKSFQNTIATRRWLHVWQLHLPKGVFEKATKRFHKGKRYGTQQSFFFSFFNESNWQWTNCMKVS